MHALKKSLGQHFLKDDNLSLKIVEAMAVLPGMQLLEIGPGGGALTRHLMEIPDIHFLAIEIDGGKVGALQNKYPGMRGKIIEGDILKCEAPFRGPFSVIGNFPYNISSQILFRVLEWKDQVEGMVGMFQKEVAERIVAHPGRKAYGILSVLVQAYFDAELLFEVGRESFIPPPKVMSAVIRLRRNGNPYSVENEKRFTRLVKTSFGQRRKMLRNPTRSLFEAGLLKEEIFNRRPEQLSIREFADLSKLML
jgi:16S rRNA (adenine1518-N6/adenine1519-N6)-dimethyltransferase